RDDRARVRRSGAAATRGLRRRRARVSRSDLHRPGRAAEAVEAGAGRRRRAAGWCEMSIVDPTLFVNAMQEKWTEYGNVSSPALRAVWTQMVSIFNVQITDPSDRWPVIPAELGAGKTMAVKTYCAMMP